MAGAKWRQSRFKRRCGQDARAPFFRADSSPILDFRLLDLRLFIFSFQLSVFCFLFYPPGWDKYWYRQKISEKSLEEILDFKNIKNRYFECLQIKNSLDESLQQLNIEYSKVLLEYERLQIEKGKLNSTINFGDR